MQNETEASHTTQMDLRPTRVRRLADPSLLADAYFMPDVSALPVEIINLHDGTVTAEWLDGRTLNYESEEDLWRACHDKIKPPRVSPTWIPSVANLTKEAPCIHEREAGVTGHFARDAWANRPAALAVYVQVGLADVGRPAWCDEKQ